MSGIYCEGPHLNLDVLLHIVSLASDIHSQSRMMKTCRVLHREGARQLLRGRHVSLYTEARLISFLLFMQVDPHVRVPALSELALYLDRTSSETADSLGDLFVKLAESENTAFRYLFLSSSEDLFTASRKLARAVMRLSRLTYVDLESAGSLTAAVLQRLSFHSPMTTVYIDFKDEVLSSPSVTAQHVDPVYLLKRTKDTLTSLEVKNWFIATRGFNVYPNLRSLTLSGQWVPSTPKLRRAFPSLSELSVYGYPNLPKSEYAFQRERNRMDQLLHGSWQSMEYFFGAPVDLYILAPICPIEQVMFDGSDHVDTNPRKLRKILSDARPVHLELQTRLRSNVTFLNDDWMSALFERRSPQLEILQLLIGVFGDDDADLGQALEAICTAVASSTLRGFRLTIDAEERKRGNERLEACINNLDVGALAQRIKDATPAMEVVSICLISERSAPQRKVRLGSAADFHALFQEPDC